jgi:autophagy-related protein 33
MSTSPSSPQLRHTPSSSWRPPTLATTPCNTNKVYQGTSASLATLALPSFLSLPTATTARTSLSYLSSRTRTFAAYLRQMTTFALFSAYLISPKRFRHPYLLYTSIFTFLSGPGVDYAVNFRQGANERRTVLDLEAQGDDVNGEEVRQAVERMKFTETIRTAVSSIAFAMSVVGIWGDGA